MRIWGRLEFELIFSLIYLYSCWFICRYQTAKSNKKVAFPVRISCNTAIIIWSLMIPSFVSSKSKLVEPLMLEKINLLYDRLKATATAKSKIISYGTSCAWTFYLIKKFFVCSCGDSLRIYFLGENSLEKISFSKDKTCFTIFSCKLNLTCLQPLPSATYTNY